MIQPIGDALWFGDEFGPFLIKTDRNGKVLAVFDAKVDGKIVRSPDNPYLVPPGARGTMKFEVQRSKGFEGMAASPDGKFLYPLLEGPLWIEATNSFESKDGKTYLRILEFDVDKAAFTGKSWKYQLELPANAIGDFNLIDATSGLIIERDDSEGDPAQACLEGAAQARLLQRAGQVQAHLQDRLRPGRCRRLRQEGGLHRPDGHRRSEQDRPPGRAATASSPSRSSPSRMSTSSTPTTSSSATTTTCPSRRAARSASPTTTS